MSNCHAGALLKRLQTKGALVGTWKLISAKDTTENADVRDSFGRNPTGFITYTADGRVMCIVTFDGRKLLSVADYISAPAKERAEAFATMFAYAGRYTLAGTKSFTILKPPGCKTT